MAAQGVKDKVKPLSLEEIKGEQGTKSNDGQIFLNKIKDFHFIFSKWLYLIFE